MHHISEFLETGLLSRALRVDGNHQEMVSSSKLSCGIFRGSLYVRRPNILGMKRRKCNFGIWVKRGKSGPEP